MDYSWRENRNPYRILISEVLLTRTKAAQVLPVFNKFIEKYPTIDEFLNLDITVVKELIKSLGLLFRAETLQKISDQIKKEFNKTIPKTLEELKLLKGIGDYSANAILCFGFGFKRPLLDANFIRIFKRVFNIYPKTKTAKSDKFLWQFSESLVPDYNFISYNYGILDIGGNICLNKKPKCEICPIHLICYYFKNHISFINNAL